MRTYDYIVGSTAEYSATERAVTLLQVGPAEPPPSAAAPPSWPALLEPSVN